MPGQEFVVEHLGAQGLSGAATLNQISDTFVGIWNLNATGSDVPENAEFLPYKNKANDGRTRYMDGRKQVDDADIAEGGKYRSIVKLFLHYANQKTTDPWVMATGWLIAPDLIVTAGHSAFDWSYKMGRLTQVKAYVGYNGKTSTNDAGSVQFRQGERVATTAEWLRSKGVRAYDLAFIKVQQAFTGVVPIGFKDTPKSGPASLGLVGYAGDLADTYTGEKGAHMYETFTSVNWNLEDSDYTMLEYAMDSFGGNSGSPVLRKDDMVSIGTHVYGGNPSLASVIGLLGSQYQNYIAAFSVESKKSELQGGPMNSAVMYVRTNTSKATQQTSTTSGQDQVNGMGEGQSMSGQRFGNQYDTPGFYQSNGVKNYNKSEYSVYQSNDNTAQAILDNPANNQTQMDVLQQNSVSNGNMPQAVSEIDDEFLEILKVGIKLSDPVLSDILHAHQPMVLGSIGSAAGALAGAVLTATGVFAKDISAAVHEFRQGLPYDGIVERAILGEAAFCVVMSMKRRRLEEDGIFSEMARIVKQIAPAAKKIAPYIMDALTGPALRIALDALYNKSTGLEARLGSATSHATPFAQSFTPSNSTLSSEAETFIKRLSAHCVDHEESENSLSSIDRIIQIGFREAGPVLTTVANEGLQYLVSVLPASASGGEGVPSHAPYIDGLLERAMLGEAALQALMKVPEQRLEESAFDVMAQSIAKIGSVILRSAHGTIEDVGFVVKAIVIAPSPSAEETIINETSPPNQATSDRGAKGFSYINLEREFLDYYRGLDKKQMAQISRA